MKRWVHGFNLHDSLWHDKNVPPQLLRKRSPLGESPIARLRLYSTTWIRLGLAVTLLLGIVLFYALGLHHQFSWEALHDNVETWKASAQEQLGISLLLFFFIYVATTALSLPVASGLSLVGGAIFGRWLGTAVVALAATLGATLAFLCSRYLLREYVQGRWSGRLRALNGGIEREGKQYLFTLRLVPLFPFWLINLGMGLTTMRTREFLWISLVGMLPGTFIYVNAGAELGSLASPRDVLSPRMLLALALLGTFPWVIRRLLTCWQKHGSYNEQH